MTEQILPVLERDAGGPQASAERVLEIVNADLCWTGPHARLLPRVVVHCRDAVPPVREYEVPVLTAHCLRL
jgi:hypothetical protein